MRIERLLLVLAMMASLAFLVAACGDDDEEGNGGGAASGESTEELSGPIRIDGSSTVFPFAEAAGELFNEEVGSGVQVTVGASGTGGGFEKFCAGETDISDASRPIKDDEEAPVCEENGIEFAELQVANDGIAVATNKDLGIECMTVEQLKMLWEPKSKVSSYSDIDPSFPDVPVKLFGPGTDSGTFDFFTDVINGEEGASREDYEASEDDNQLVTGVAGTSGGLAYFGFSYYEANQDKLNLVQVDGGNGCVAPSLETIQDGSYAPLSRPIFMYPAKSAMEKPQVEAFLDFTLENQQVIAEAAKIVPMTEEQASESGSKLQALESGA
jgi:phosphate transport system substrate-binding protein